MKRYVGVIAAVVFAVVTMVWASNKWSTKKVEGERDANAARIKTEYLERVAWIRANPDDKAYKSEVTTFFSWYFRQIDDHIKRFNLNPKFDGYLDELDKRTKDPQVAEKKAAYEYAKKMFDLFRSGKYEPVWSGTDKGLRLDIVSVSPAASGGEAKTRYQIVLWGAQREQRDDGKTKRMLTNASFNIVWKLTDEKGKLISEMNASGDPASKIDYPERFIAEFPPMLLLGHYDVDLLPAEAKVVEITFNVGSRAPSGGDIRSTFTWKLDVPAEWKLRAGQSWTGAQESVRSQEEIDASTQKGQAKR